jgi:hypothetical protein
MDANETQLYKKVNNVWQNSSEIAKVMDIMVNPDIASLLYVIKVINTDGKCLDVSSDGSRAINATCNGSNTQKWMLKGGELVNYNNVCVQNDLNSSLGTCETYYTRKYRVDSNNNLYSSLSTSWKKL